MSDRTDRRASVGCREEAETVNGSCPQSTPARAHSVKAAKSAEIVIVMNSRRRRRPCSAPTPITGTTIGACTNRGQAGGGRASKHVGTMHGWTGPGRGGGNNGIEPTLFTGSAAYAKGFGQWRSVYKVWQRLTQASEGAGGSE